MPKVNQTMLDKLVDAFKSGSQGAPFREMKIHGEFTDPMVKARVNQQLAGNRLIKLDPSWRTPERVKYQKGIEARISPRIEEAREKRGKAWDLRDQYENEWLEAVGEAKSDMADDWASTLDYQDFDEVNPDILEDVAMPSSNLRDFWPEGARDPDEIYRDFDAAQDAYYVAKRAEDELFTPRYRMREQTMTPRYRRYQEAMQRRDINRRAGRVNAAIMNLARQGYSLPEIREILRRQGR